MPVRNKVKEERVDTSYKRKMIVFCFDPTPCYRCYAAAPVVREIE